MREESMFANAFTGICDKNGVEIHEGDRVRGLFRFGIDVDSVCRFDPFYAAFGLELYRGQIREFTPFCHMCNTEYEVIKDDI